MPVTTVTSKGQITLPKEVREHLHIGEGDRLEFLIAEGGEVLVRPVAGSVVTLFGLLRRPGIAPRSAEEIDAAISRVVIEDDRRIRRGE
jgi:AbrB family looped-hinge helix DNA binding protein